MHPSAHCPYRICQRRPFVRASSNPSSIRRKTQPLRPSDGRSPRKYCSLSHFVGWRMEFALHHGNSRYRNSFLNDLQGTNVSACSTARVIILVTNLTTSCAAPYSVFVFTPIPLSWIAIYNPPVSLDRCRVDSCQPNLERHRRLG